MSDQPDAQYRMLKDGDTIQERDEFESSLTPGRWFPCKHSIGKTWYAGQFQPMRRLLNAATQTPSDQPEAAAQKIIELACEGPLRLDDVMAEIAPIVQERDEILERLSECSKEMCLWNRKCEDARVERDEARAERDELRARVNRQSEIDELLDNDAQRVEDNLKNENALLAEQRDAALASLATAQKERDELIKMMNDAALEAGHDGYDESTELWRSVASFFQRAKREWEKDVNTAEARVARLETILSAAGDTIDRVAKTMHKTHMDFFIDCGQRAYPVLAMASKHIREALSDPAPSGAPPASQQP